MRFIFNFFIILNLFYFAAFAQDSMENEKINPLSEKELAYLQNMRKCELIDNERTRVVVLATYMNEYKPEIYKKEDGEIFFVNIYQSPKEPQKQTNKSIKSTKKDSMKKEQKAQKEKPQDSIKKQDFSQISFIKDGLNLRLNTGENPIEIRSIKSSELDEQSKKNAIKWGEYFILRFKKQSERSNLALRLESKNFGSCEMNFGFVRSGRIF